MRRQGKRRSIVKGATPEDTILMQVLFRRHREARRDQRLPFQDVEPRASVKRETVPGMPLGLPPLPMDQLSLVKTWIAQGARGPKR